jgi:hypothetical protein
MQARPRLLLYLPLPDRRRVMLNPLRMMRASPAYS